jgi:trk system potassium uptake protein TrkH
MIFSSFLILNLTKKTSKVRSIEPASSLSTDLSITALAKQIIAYTAICEIGGLILLFFHFRSEGIDNALWNALFHSVSAFCTAGFSLFSSNLEGYKNHLGINTIISFLSLFGAFGFFLWMGFFKRIMNRKTLIGLATRIMKPFATVAIIIGGFLFLLMTTFPIESSKLQKLTISFFQAISTITTTGFNTVDIRAFPLSIHLLIVILMLLGVSFTGNGKDMRGTSFTIWLELMANTLRNKVTNSLWSRKVLFKRTTLAFSSFAAYFFVLVISALLLSLIETQPFFLLFFETTSALCTVGLSMGITPELSTLGKSLIALLMLTGRIGILIIGFAISTRAISWDRKRNQELVS